MSTDALDPCTAKSSVAKMLNIYMYILWGKSLPATREWQENIQKANIQINVSSQIFFIEKINSCRPCDAYIIYENYAIISLDNGLLPAQHHAITWTNADLSSTWSSGTNINEISIKIQCFLFQKLQMKMSREYCSSLNESTLLMLATEYFDLSGQYHAYWCPGSPGNQ